MKEDTVLIKAALRVAKKYPVFPTNGKKPVWSNAELGVGRGQGGFKIATQDPVEVRRLFSHARATEISVPTGAASGLLCIDADIYKNPELNKWLADNEEYLKDTLCHNTRSGGKHFLFKHPPGAKFPSTLRAGVDVKSTGGYICWPGTEGYTEHWKGKVRSFPMEFITKALKEKHPQAKTNDHGMMSGTFNATANDTLILQIISGEELYPALRSLSYRLADRRDQSGKALDRAGQLAYLYMIMDRSVAADHNHERHADWEDRRAKIEDLVDSASDKRKAPEISGAALSNIMAGESFMDAQKAIAGSVRPIGPQRETKASDIEARVAELEDEAPQDEAEDEDEYFILTAGELRKTALPPIEWVVDKMFPKQGIISLAGTSNVGKTRWLAALVMALAVGDTERMGLPPCKQQWSSLWLGNEERMMDLARRIKAVTLQHGDKKSGSIAIRGKDTGMLRLVAINEAGNPEIDEKNIAKIVKQARLLRVALIIFDPYVTLSDAVDENSAASAAILTKAFLLITELTGAAVLHAHHTPKDRTKSPDWYRGDAGAWRGSGAIYSALDCGYTLSAWMPRDKTNRAKWKEQTLEDRLDRFIVLDTGKIREGEAPSPVVYELVGQEMDEGEGMPIGVCQLSSPDSAMKGLHIKANAQLSATVIADAIIEEMQKAGVYDLTDVHQRMKASDIWFTKEDRLYRDPLIRCLAMFDNPVNCTHGTVQIIERKAKTTGKYKVKITTAKENDDD